MTREPTFPPLFTGEALAGTADPFEVAQARATLGCDAGLVVHNLTADTFRAAMVFAPEVPLQQAMTVMIACGLGFQNALGALAPPEVAVHLEWNGPIRVNAARCGTLSVAASIDDPSGVPDWIVIGLTIPMIPASDNPGETPDETCLYEEGCVEVDPVHLLEAWVRHSLIWITRMEDDGNRTLHSEWRGLAHGMGEDITLPVNDGPMTGTFMGVDEDFGMLLRSGEDTHLIPLARLLS